MPEYPDIIVHIEHLRTLLQGRVLEQVRLSSPFLMRTFDPPIDSIKNKRVSGMDRIGKRIVFQFGRQGLIPAFKGRLAEVIGGAGGER